MADRYNTRKIRFSDIPLEALEAIAMVFNYGAEKYSLDNWRQPPYFERKVFEDCITRHTAAIHRGELIDPESGCLHSAHIACNAIMAVYYDLYGHFYNMTCPHTYAKAIRDTLIEEWNDAIDRTLKQKAGKKWDDPEEDECEQASKEYDDAI